jgi:hypothetical protein
MRNSKLIKEASKMVFDELFKMPVDEFHKMLEKNELGILGSLLYETNTIETILDSKTDSIYTKYYHNVPMYITSMSYMDVTNHVGIVSTVKVSTVKASDNYTACLEDSIWQKAA